MNAYIDSLKSLIQIQSFNVILISLYIRHKENQQISISL
uniref:Uncharacterized protein n=1 Tax=Rhizophora mucronata TaxID=61149 RepID=A0A2P2NQL0_RHIMU